jgi:hypothetical protein
MIFVHLDILPAEARTPPRRRLEGGAPMGAGAPRLPPLYERSAERIN